jgi:hypothetical protein
MGEVKQEFNIRHFELQSLSYFSFVFPHTLCLSRDSSVRIVAKLRVWCPRAGGAIRGRGKGFCVFHKVQTTSGAHPDSNTMGTGGVFQGVKRLGRDANHSPSSSVESVNVWSYLSIGRPGVVFN